MANDITGIGSVFDFGAKIIDKLFPDKDKANEQKLKLFEMSQAGEFKEMDQTLELAKGQQAINLAETQSGGLMNQWRPALGWVCVLSYAYNYFAGPLFIWTAELIGQKAPAMVALDTTELGVLLFGMLGIGGMRSWDKKVKAATTLNLR